MGGEGHEAEGLPLVSTLADRFVASGLCLPPWVTAGCGGDTPVRGPDGGGAPAPVPPPVHGGGFPWGMAALVVVGMAVAGGLAWAVSRR